MSDQPFAIGWDILTPMTDWLMLLGDHSHLGPLLSFADQSLSAVDEGWAPRRPIRVVHEARVERRVDRERSVAQRTIGGGRIEISPETRESIRGLGGCRLRGWEKIGRVSPANETKARQGSQAESSHESPRTPGFARKRLSRSHDGEVASLSPDREQEFDMCKRIYHSPQHERPAILGVAIAY
jgi:hypothetical protein